MKKAMTLILSALILCASSACSSQSESKSAADTTAATQAAQTTEAPAETPTLDAETAASVEETITDNEFEGVIYAVKDSTPVFSFAEGTQENGEEITIDTPMPVGSVSKQFCAAAVLLLQEQGKLSVDDTLDKYFPEYADGKKITLHHLLSMRTGLPELTEDLADVVTIDNTEEENVAAIKKWLFSQPLTAESDQMFAYKNINYFLLGNIVEQVSNQKYADFLRENFFTPLEMTHTGTIGEAADSPEWAQGSVFEHVDAQPGLTKGAGDIISNAKDMTVWINALSSGKIISADSYQAMTTDYSPEEHYGYGMYLEIEDGVGHFGAIGDYSAFDYINEEKDFTLFVAGNTIYPPDINGLAYDLLADLLF